MPTDKDRWAVSVTEKNRRDREEARAARERWEQAIADGRDHHTVGRFWESYLDLAHKAGAYMELEHEAALRQKEVQS